MPISEQISVAIIAGLTSILSSVILVFGVQRLQARSEAKSKEADATKTLQDVIASMGGVYDSLVEHVREAAEQQIAAKYRDRIEELEQRVQFLESERAEWQIGIGLLLGQLASMGIDPTWKPKLSESGKLKPK